MHEEYEGPERREHHFGSGLEQQKEMVTEAVEAAFAKYGFNEDDRVETKLDMTHLRNSRKGAELVKKTIIGTAIGTFVTVALWAIGKGLLALVGK